MNKIRPIAIYLPQYHPIPENDEWWGKGFTEWTNVVVAEPLCSGHYQPQLPADLGFYDLRLNEIFYEQIKMAKDAEIYGFMFYEYWFEGKRLLEKPIENYLADAQIDFPYLLCWANENWTRKWDGLDAQVLLKQSYSVDDFAAHFDKVYARHIINEKYIKVDDKPVIAIYKPELIENLDILISLWREKALELGLPGIYFINCEANGIIKNPEIMGFDASYEFQPNWSLVGDHRIKRVLNLERYINFFPSYRIKNFLRKYLIIKSLLNTFIDYKTYSEDNRHNKHTGYKRFPGITTSWDNSPRRRNGGATVFLNSTPDLYRDWFKRLLDKFHPYSDSENFIFINAWNEWAEGAHLEPCKKWKHSYLNATKEVMKST
jgi:lipopolysaccharide biosynthesis protein